MVVATKSLAPKAPLVSVGNLPPTIPPHSWSDLACLCWKDVCENKAEDIRNLRWIIRDTIDNLETKHVIDQVLDQHNVSSCNEEEEYITWPGETLSTATYPGQALLGTPNCYGPMYMLGQHQETLGEGLVESFQVFYNDKEEPCLALKIVPIS